MTFSPANTPHRPGKWEDAKVEPVGIGNLLSDGSCDSPEISVLFEQDGIARQVLQTVVEFFGRGCNQKNCRDGNGLQAPKTLFLALHGRLGQGKTRVIRKIVEELDGKMLQTRRWQVPLRVAEFNCSDYRTEDLLENFDHFIENGRTLRIMFFSALCSGLVAWAFSQLPIFSKTFDAKIGISAAIIVAFTAGFASMRHILRDLWRDIRTGKPAGSVFLRGSDRLLTRWDLLIIDDLDRATVKQQRALLQSLNRHRQDMSGVVLVAFDDVPLVFDETPRAESSEILIKAFDASFRLSPMNATDAGNMAHAYGRELYQINKTCKIARAFAEPVVCGALARVFLLHGNASARFAKKLINNVYLTARLGAFSHYADLLALIRLHGVFHYLPVLETELDFLAQAMLDSTEESLYDVIRKRFGNDLDTQVQTRLHEILKATHHMQPTSLGWLRSFRIWRDNPADQSKKNKLPAGWRDIWTRNWAINEAFLTRTKDPRARRRLYEEMRRLPLKLLVERELTPKSDGVLTDQESSFEENLREPESYWRAMVASLMAFDDDVLNLLPNGDSENLLEEHRKRPLPVLLFAHSARSCPNSLHFAFRHSLHAPETNLEDRLRHDFAHTSDKPGLSVLASLPRLPNDGVEEVQSSFIERGWPHFAPDEASHHFRQLGLVLADLPQKSEVFPNAHLDAVCVLSESGKFDSVRKMLHLIHPPEPKPFRHFGAQQRFWQRMERWPEYRKKLVTRLCEEFHYGKPVFTDLWMLAVLDNNSLQIVADALPNDADIFKQILSSIDRTPSIEAHIEELANLHRELGRVYDIWR